MPECTASGNIENCSTNEVMNSAVHTLVHIGCRPKCKRFTCFALAPLVKTPLQSPQIHLELEPLC